MPDIDWRAIEAKNQEEALRRAGKWQVSAPAYGPGPVAAPSVPAVRSAAYPSNMSSPDTTGFYRPSSLAAPVNRPLSSPPAPAMPSASSVAAGPTTTGIAAPGGGVSSGGYNALSAADRAMLRERGLGIAKQRDQIVRQLAEPGMVTDPAQRQALIAQRHSLEADLGHFNRALDSYHPMTPEQSMASRDHMAALYDRVAPQVAAQSTGGDMFMSPRQKFEADQQARSLHLYPARAADRASFHEFMHLSGRGEAPIGYVAGGSPSPVTPAAPNPFGPTSPAEEHAAYQERMDKWNAGAAARDLSTQKALQIAHSAQAQEQYAREEAARAHEYAAAQQKAAIAGANAQAIQSSPENIQARMDLERKMLESQQTQAATGAALAGLQGQTALAKAERAAAAESVNDPETNYALGQVASIAKERDGHGFYVGSHESDQMIQNLEASVAQLQQKLARANPQQRAALRNAIAETAAGLSLSPRILAGHVAGPMTDRFYQALQKFHQMSLGQ